MIKEGQIYEDCNGVRFKITKIDLENNYIKKEVVGNLLFDYGFTDYTFENNLEKFKLLLENGCVWLYKGNED